MAVKLSAALTLLLLLPIAAYAQGVDAHQADTVIQALKAATAAWNGPLQRIALDLFGILAVISFSLSMGFAYLNGDGLTGTFAVALRLVIVLGAYLFLLENWAAGQQFGQAIIASFQSAAQQAGGTPSSPAQVFAMGLDFAWRTIQMGSFWDPLRSGILILVAIIVAAIYAVAAAIMLISIGKALLTVSFGTLAIGFAGSDYTVGMARNALFMTIAVGARLFSMQLITSVVTTIIQTWLGATTALDQISVMAIIGLGLIFCVLVHSIPAMVEHMFAGSGHGHAGPGALVRNTSMALSVASGAGGAMATAGAAMQKALPTGGGIGPLPPQPGGAGGAAAASAGMSMRPRP